MHLHSRNNDKTIMLEVFDIGGNSCFINISQFSPFDVNPSLPLFCLEYTTSSGNKITNSV